MTKKTHFEWDDSKNYENQMKHGVMKKKITYTDEPMDNVTVIDDFLPSPEELAFKEETVKVTISLSKNSVDFFKQSARTHHTQYQKMIRRLLDEYVNRQQQMR